MVHALHKTGTLVGNNIRHVGTTKSIYNKYEANDHQRRAKCPAGCFQQHY